MAPTWDGPAPALPDSTAQRRPSSSCQHPDRLPSQPMPCGKEASLPDPGSQGDEDWLQARGWARTGWAR